VASVVIGIDVGTSGTKSGIYDENGRLVSSAFEESTLIYPRPGWVEQRPDDIERSVHNTIRNALNLGRVKSADVAAIAIAGQMGGVSTVDKNWEPVTHYDSWLDTRCAPFLETLKTHSSEILASSGGMPSYNHGPKILYWKNEFPEAWGRIRAFIQPAAYVAGRLAGLRGDDAFIDPTYLSYAAFADTANVRWNEDLLSYYHLDVSKFPHIVDPWHVIGRVTSAAAAVTGLLEGTPIAAGCGDGAANVLGGGLVEPNMTYDLAGTAACLSVVTDRFVTDQASGAMITSPHVIPGLYTIGGYVAGGGLNLRWFRDVICSLESKQWEELGKNPYDEIGRMAANAPLGADKLFFLPHFAGRSTPNDPAMRGGFFGLTWRHTKDHMARAIMESIAYEYSLYREAIGKFAPFIEFSRIVGFGGGAKSALFRQMKADILNLPYSRLERDELGTLGSGIVAGKSVGLFEDLAATARKFSGNQKDETFPIRNNGSQYVALSSFYKELIDESSFLFNRLAKFGT
jgi:xylulokinase